MKSERRILIIKAIKCKNQVFSSYFLIRGAKGLEHYALLKGDSTSVLNYIKKSKLSEEVREVIDLSKEDIKATEPLKNYANFINKVVSETHRLICRELATNNLDDIDG